MSKIIFLKYKKNYFHTIPSKEQLQLHSQTSYQERWGLEKKKERGSGGFVKNRVCVVNGIIIILFLIPILRELQ